MAQDVTHGLSVTMPEASSASSFFKEGGDNSLVQIEEDQVSLPEPSIKGIQESQPLLHGFTGITQLGESSDKRVQVRAK
jgi:hypothetical protein